MLSPTGNREPKIAVIGAGLGGIATAINLKKAGIDDFTVFEQSGGPGGVWQDNTYPGCEVDIHSYFYSFSFMPWDWSRTHAKQPELLAYCQSTIDHFGVRENFRFNSAVRKLVWIEARQQYELELENGELDHFDAVVSALGVLNNPNYPKWAGLESYEGASFHTARWNHEHDLTGKTVGYVGTGSTGAQVVPSIASTVKQLYVFQREPGWMVPKDDREFTPQERAEYMGSSRRRMKERYKWFKMTAQLVRAQLAGKQDQADALRQQALDHLHSVVADPELREQLTPTYPIGCKRTVRDSLTNSYLEALTRDNVKLVPHAVTEATPAGLVAGDVEYKLDTVIFGTGFQVQKFLPNLEVLGERAVSLHDVWGESPSAFVGSTVPGFPNFFMVGGPNSAGGGSIIYQNERSAELAVRMIKRIKPGERSVVTRKRVHALYVQRVQNTLNTKMAFQRECNNYYFSADGKNIFHFPGTHLQWHFATVLWPLVGMKTRRRDATLASYPTTGSAAVGKGGPTTQRNARDLEHPHDNLPEDESSAGTKHRSEVRPS